MNIGMICYPTFGGSGVVATELGTALADKGHQVHFITYRQPVRLNFLSKNIHFHRVFVEKYPLFEFRPYNLALSSKIVEVVMEYNLQIIHVHYAIPYAYAAYMAKQMLLEKGVEIKVVTTLHGTDITLVGSHPDYKEAVEFSINQSDAVTAVSNSLKEDTLRLFSIKKPIDVIYNFIDFPHYSSCDCDRRKIANDDEKIITHISNFRPVKRVNDVVAIFDKIQREIPAKLVLIGEGPDREFVENQAKKLGVLDKILMVGNSNEVNTFLCLSDLFLLPSEAESFGLVALEAMALKTPVVSSNAGGLSEVNIHGKTGFLSDVGNVEEMSENAIKILKEEQKLQQFKENAYRQAQNFRLDKMLPLYEEIYKRLVG
ncbi:MAG: N-acetyl-alpha-D-glucosaminyl L-malate synthase BshA [Flavobacteriaceae bacterium]|nr:N-acetyl-alpha-D-glucosaminyl L-malate synthase BshA [Flavobacteriaceae bacterium]